MCCGYRLRIFHQLASMVYARMPDGMLDSTIRRYQRLKSKHIDRRISGSMQDQPTTGSHNLESVQTYGGHSTVQHRKQRG